MTVKESWSALAEKTQEKVKRNVPVFYSLDVAFFWTLWIVEMNQTQGDSPTVLINGSTVRITVHLPL